MKHILPFALAAAMVAPITAHAVGSDDSKPPKPTETSTECEKGQVFDQETKTCLDVKSESMTDDLRYEGARELAYGERYDEALEILATAENPKDPRILNYKGFVNRKLGKTDIAMAFYSEALEINPDYILARSYMGQGLAASGDVAAAKAQLAEIAARGGEDTWAYEALSKALAGKSTY
jgi:tetratricopeptide (TPR) repeat protein